MDVHEYIAGLAYAITACKL